MKLVMETLAPCAVLLLCIAPLQGDDLAFTEYSPSNQPYFNNQPNYQPYFNQPQSTMSGSTTNQDSAINGRVKQVLMNDATLSNDARNIDVSVIDRNVTLVGSVKNNNERNKVLRMVNKVQGVNRVDEHLTILGQ